VKDIFSKGKRHSDISGKTNDRFLKKFLYMTFVVLVVYSILSIIGFYLWFAFPVETINNVTYLKYKDLILYYSVINFNDVTGILLFSNIIYFRNVNSSSPLRDGFYLGIYLVVFSWVLDLFIYVFIRKTLPTLNEYFLGKNQPEIGIAWLTAFSSAIATGWLQLKKQRMGGLFSFKRVFIILVSITFLSIVLTVTGIRFFDIRP
jgi:hypothetical protein